MKRQILMLSVVVAVALFWALHPAGSQVTSVPCNQLPPITGDVTRTAGSCVSTLAAGSASNLNAGTLAAARGGAGTINGALKGNGSGTVSQAACADLSDGTTNCSAAVGQLPGTTTNDSASSGKVGEFVSSTVASGSAVSLTTATIANITSISLTAGDWDVWFDAYFTPQASTVANASFASIETTNSAGPTQTAGQFGNVLNQTGSANAYNVKAGPFRVSTASTVTRYGNVFAGFSAGTLSAWGTLRARRVR